MAEPARMSDPERINFLEKTLERQLKLIGAADAKTSLILALSTAMLGVLAGLAPSAPNWNEASAFWAIGAGLPLLASMAFLATASFPRTEAPAGPSLIYFEGIIQTDCAGFERKVQSLTAAEYIADLTRQCHRNAEIAKAKYSWLQSSMKALFAAMLPWGVAVFKLYQERQ